MNVKVTVEMDERDWGILGAIDKVREAMLEFNRYGDEEYRNWAYSGSGIGYDSCRKLMMQLLEDFGYHHGLRGVEFAKAMDELSGNNGESFTDALKRNAHYLKEVL